MSNLYFIIGTTLMYSTPLIFAALGGLLNEKSGVVNIGLEGIMVMGAFVGAAVAYFTHNPWLAFLAAGFSGMLMALFHAVVTVTYRGDQIISGLALNMLAPALAFLLTRYFFSGAESTPALPLEDKMPLWFSSFFTSGSFLGSIFIQRSVVYIAFFSVVLVYFFIYKTKWGLYIRAAGESPETLHSLGIKVNTIRFWSVLASGFLVGLGGSALVLDTVSIFRVGVISGQGFIALAALIFGRWNPWGVYLACLFFGLASAGETLIGFMPLFRDVIPSSLIKTFPYIITLVVLVFFSKKTYAPKASGKPFIPSH